MNNMRMCKYLEILFILLISMLSSSYVLALSGSWTGDEPCPVPNGSGLTNTVLFSPLGGIPQDAVITLVTGTSDVVMEGQAELPTIWLSAGSSITTVGYPSYYLDSFFDEVVAYDRSFRLSMAPVNQNDRGFGGRCIINVSWGVPGSEILPEVSTEASIIVTTVIVPLLLQ